MTVETTRAAAQRHHKAHHLDLRGPDVVRLNRPDGAGSLAGVAVTEHQARWLGPVLARALGVTIAEEEP